MIELGQRDILLTISQLLAKYNIPYLLSGSLAVSYYGFPRATHDIDFVVEVGKQNSSKMLDVVGDLGEKYLCDEGEVKKAILEFSQFNLFHIATGIKIDFWPLRDMEFEKNKLLREKTFILGKQRIKIISPEDLILTKLLWCKEVRSEKHLRDCRGVIKVQGENLDRKYLSLWIKRFKLEKLFEGIG